MIGREELLQCSITKFTKFGSKRFTLDDLAKTLGISKKTIYKFFHNKEELVAESVLFLINNYKKDIAHIIEETEKDPVLCVILIYKKGFEYLKYFKPSFLFGIKKYYPKADAVFNNFKSKLVNDTVFHLLKAATEKKQIKPQVNLRLICDLYFLRFDDIVFKTNTFFELYTEEELLNHFIVYNLRGITTASYSNIYFE